jgi:hypothetical protein
MDIEDVIRLLHEYDQDVEEGMSPVQIKTKFSDLLGFLSIISITLFVILDDW